MNSHNFCRGECNPLFGQYFCPPLSDPLYGQYIIPPSLLWSIYHPLMTVIYFIPILLNILIDFIIFCNMIVQAEFLCLQHPCGYCGTPSIRDVLPLELSPVCDWFPSQAPAGCSATSLQLAQCIGSNNQASSHTSSPLLPTGVFFAAQEAILVWFNRRRYPPNVPTEGHAVKYFSPVLGESRFSYV